jgi:hypothetical protein
MIPSFLTHYNEAERGPFRNVCDLDDRIAQAKRKGLWVFSYIESHIWDPDIREKVRF